MKGHQAAGTDQAVKAYTAGADVYALAGKYGITVSTLYRALKRAGYKFKRGNGHARRTA